jgi:NADPH:quinone reductase-like Zn-dependent oxidoreductase
VLGWDAAGVVMAVGPNATLLPDDAVFYAGTLGRSGSNSNFTCRRAHRAEARSLNWSLWRFF